MEKSNHNNRTKSKFFTIMLIPHSEKSSFTIKLPIYVFQGLAFALVLTAVFAINFFGNYLSMVDKASEAAELRVENRQQQEKIDKFAEKTEELKTDMERLAETEEKVREMLGIDPPEKGEGKVADAQDELAAKEKVQTDATDSNLFRASSTAEHAGNTIRKLAGELPYKQVEMDELKEAAVEKEEEQAHTPSLTPVHGRITSGFGDRRNPLTGAHEFHEGVDIATNHGTPIQAPANGQIVYRDYRGGYGNMIIIEHGYGYSTYYAHLSDFNVSLGEQVKAGDVIGYVGSTGASTAPHLHYEVHVNNSPTNPKEYMTE